MTWRARAVSGILIPWDERVEINWEPITRSIHEWLVSSGIDFMEIVHGENCRDHDFAMIVDDEGLDKRMPWNERAQFFSGYAIQAPIVGNALFFSTDWVDDGMDIVSIKSSAVAWLTNDHRKGQYDVWCKNPAVQEYAAEYNHRYPPQYDLPPKH